MSRVVKSVKELGSMPGYTFEYERYVPDCKGHGMVFRHTKSGAKVAVISNDDDNKTFYIGFRTTPSNDTGVPHIIEHSVLCGSDKFPPKDPFMELAKGSLNTFLNAFTYPDKTCYPVCSCNDRDFANLMDVYMDAVLHPNIYKREEIFKQEGWHYELNAKDEPITINGVVYSEMKGAFSTPDSRQSREIFHELFPDNTYGVESGGDPVSIPDLTYEQFLDFHKNYYHPSNSYIFLYGDMDIEERLNWLDSEYLCKYDLLKVDSEIRHQSPVGVKEVNSFYPIGEDDSEENAGYLAWAFTFADYDDLFMVDAMDMLTDVLVNLPGAPLKEALIKAGIGQDISCYVTNYISQPGVILTVQNTEVSKLDDMKRIIRGELEKIVKEGINKKSLLAAINGAEFRYCEADFGSTPKGLAYGVDALRTWLYSDGMAFDALCRTERFPILRDNIESGYFEKLIVDHMLNSNNMVYHTLAPKRGMGAEEEKKLADKLAEMKASMTDEELEKLIADTEKLKKYQAEPSTAEELMTIPMLERGDIAKKTQELIISECEIAGAKTYFHDVDANGIVYFKMLFDLDRIAPEDIKYIPILTSLIGDMDTASYSYLELNNEINIYTGGIGMSVDTFSIRGERDAYRPMLRVMSSVMGHSFDKALELMKELMYNTDFSSLTRIREIMAESKSQLQYSMPAAGHRTAMNRAVSSISSVGAFGEELRGVSAYNTVCRILEMNDGELESMVSKLKDILRNTLGRDNLLIDITCDKELFESIKSSVENTVREMDSVRNRDTDSVRRGHTYEHNVKNEAFKTAGEVTYLALAGLCEGVEPKLAGSIAVAQSILSKEYLWNNVRVLGGAYGAGFTFNSISGVGSFYSYRDPHLAETLAVYRKAADFLREFEADERTMTKFVIGTMGTADTPLNPLAKGSRALHAAINGTTYEMLQQTRDSILSTTVEDIRAVADVLDGILDSCSLCAVGNENIINDNKDMFSEVKNLL